MPVTSMSVKRTQRKTMKQSLKSASMRALTMMTQMVATPRFRIISCPIVSFVVQEE